MFVIYHNFSLPTKGGKTMDQKFIDLHDEYIHNNLGRRDFLKKLTLLAGSAAAANALLLLLENDYAKAEIVPKDDPRLESGYDKYTGATGEIRAYTAKPKGSQKLPGVVVVHENRGLNPHIEDVTRRIALEGFWAVAPDALSPVGGTPDDPDKARDLIRGLDGKSTLQNFVAAAKYLKTHAGSTGKVGCVGFCWGGRMANQLAVSSQDLTAVVPYYGGQPKSEDVPKIKAALLLHYAGLDKKVNAGIAAYEAALKNASVDYQMYMYDGAKHAFNNDTNAARYNKEAAQLAWQRTIAFLKEKLKN